MVCSTFLSFQTHSLCLFLLTQVLKSSFLSFVKSLGLENPYAEFSCAWRCLLLPCGVVLQLSCASKLSSFFMYFLVFLGN